MKFINSHYEDGHSFVTVKHLKKMFFGEAKVHPDDINKASEFAGCSYAEDRATIKALKYERKIAKDEAEICKKFIKACESTKTWDKNSATAKVAYHQLNCKIKKVNQLTEKINQLLLKINKSILERDITLNAFEKNKQKKLNQNLKK